MKIINNSLEKGIFPESWKTSTVIPIPKVTNTKRAAEFRPINKLPTYEKILEEIVKKQLNEFIETNKIIRNEQSGFREKQSCETAIQAVLDEWKINIDTGKKVGIIFLDLKRAFETVDRSMLIEKMYKYGIKGDVQKWFISYLVNRKQKVKYNNIISEEISVDLGVPQGSVLGPILFIMYINDLIKYIINLFANECKIQLFADDTLLYVIGETEAEIEFKLQSVFIAVQEWLRVNKLIMNVEKTKFMILHSGRNIEERETKLFTTDLKEIQRVYKMKYLGVIIDSKLNFKDYIEYIVKKTGKRLIC